MVASTDDEYFSGSGLGYDAESVRFFDVAHEGAQIRLLAGSLDQLSAALQDSQPRSVVILPTDQVARAAAEFAASWAEPSRVPVVVSETLPRFIGALDVVLVVGERAECDWASRALIAAAGKGATVVLAGPGRGPVLEDAPEQTIVIPALPTAAGTSPARCIMVVYSALALLTEDAGLVKRELEALAEAVDAELDQLSPQRDDTVNPGRELRRFVEGAWVVHCGGSDARAWDEPPRRVDTGALVARVAGAVWATHGLGGTVVDAAELSGVIERSRESRGGQANRSVEDDLFHDPFLDEPLHGDALVPLRMVLWGQDDSALPDSLAVNVTIGADTAFSTGPRDSQQLAEQSGFAADVEELARALRLITRSFAATAYEIA